MSASGRISPPGTRGTTEYDPPRCMFASERSLVSCSASRPSARTTPLLRVASIDATAGLHTSQPSACPAGSSPCAFMTSSKLEYPFAATSAMSSGLEYAKCSQMWFLTSAPILASSALRIFLTSGSQPPQPDPARVSVLSAAYDALSPSFSHALISVPRETSLHEQICFDGSAASSSVLLGAALTATPAEGGGSKAATGPSMGAPALKSAYNLA
mmetsp:Transcript_25710/g.102604  ORF Transcript_25710/g.102604 Transcript_25710/m.102604 type:complete len:214 (+) Transcript_25710:3429-4070(+)